jgi:hypothetical protein
VPSIPRDLQTICLKCLEKRPQDRYPSAGAVSRDLNHFLSGEPITARPPSPVMKLRYWLKKHPKVLSRSFALAAALVVIGLGSLWIQAERAREGSEEGRQKAIAAEEKAQAHRMMAEKARAEAERQQAIANMNRAEAERQSAILKKQQEAQSGDKPAAGEPATK